MHGLGMQVEGGGEEEGGGLGCSRLRRGLKKAEPGVWWADWCMFFFSPHSPFPPVSLLFCARGDAAVC